MSIVWMNAVWSARRLTSVQRLVLLSLTDQANDEGVCWPSMRTISLRCNCSDRYARQVVHELEHGGYLRVVERKAEAGDNQTNLYILLPDLLKPMDIGMHQAEFQIPPREEPQLPTGGTPDPTNQQLTTKKNQVPGRPGKKILDHPALAIYRELTHLNVVTAWRDTVIVLVGDNPADLNRWRETILDWLGHGWNKGSIKGMLNRYQGIPFQGKEVAQATRREVYTQLAEDL